MSFPIGKLTRIKQGLTSYNYTGLTKQNQSLKIKFFKNMGSLLNYQCLALGDVKYFLKRSTM